MNNIKRVHILVSELWYTVAMPFCACMCYTWVNYLTRALTLASVWCLYSYWLVTPGLWVLMLYYMQNYVAFIYHTRIKYSGITQLDSITEVYKHIIMSLYLRLHSLLRRPRGKERRSATTCTVFACANFPKMYINEFTLEASLAMPSSQIKDSPATPPQWNLPRL